MNTSNSNVSSISRGLALVTGASRGIGAAISKRLARDGFHVILNYQSNESRAREVLDQITAGGGKASLLRFDVSNAAEVSTAFESIAELSTKLSAKLEVLVNNAGITIDSLLIRVKEEDIDKTFAIDLKGAILCAREASKIMMKARKGSIIQVSSVVGEMGNAGQTVYAAAKSGLIGFSKSLAKELGSRGVRVNVITPGYIQTEMTEGLTDAQKESILRNIVLGTMGSPDDIANAVSFLSSEESRYLTGQVIGVNGGLYM